MPRGICITAVQSGSPAETAGLVAGDILTAADHVAVSSMDDLTSLLYSHAVGDTMVLTIYRSGGQGDVTVTLTESRGKTG